MISEKQLIANRKNAIKGGVKTEEGKALVRLNALKHGLLCQEVLLHGEDSDALNELRESIISGLQPEGELEVLLIERIVSSIWRLRRAIRVETDFLQAELESRRSALAKGDSDAKAWKMLVVRELGHGSVWLNLTRYETAIERQIYKALHELIRLQMARHDQKPPAPLAFDLELSHRGLNGFVS